MWLSLLLIWLDVLFAVSGTAWPLDLAELIVYNAGQAAPSGDLVYAGHQTTLFVKFFVAREQVIRVADTLVRVGQRTEYPRSGDIELRIEPDRPAMFTIAVRFPGWTRGQLPWGDRSRFENADMPAPTLMVNSEAVHMTFDRGFAKVTREWRSGDVIHIFFLCGKIAWFRDRQSRIRLVMSCSVDRSFGVDHDQRTIKSLDGPEFRRMSQLFSVKATPRRRRGKTT
jgi:hypothetical protein